MIAISILEENQLLSEGIQAMLLPIENMKVVSCVTTAEEALDDLQCMTIDLFIVNAMIKDLNAITFARDVKKLRPDIKLLFITSKLDEANIIQALLAGVDGYVSHMLNEEVLLQAIGNICNKHVIFSKESASVLIDYILATAEGKEEKYVRTLRERGIHLTKSEVKTALLMLEQKSVKEISEALQFTCFTVRSYMSNIYRKIDVRNKKEAVAYLEELGIHADAIYLQ